MKALNEKRLMIIFSSLLMIIIFLSIVSAEECEENWRCNDWEECFDGITERYCYDFNDCGTIAEKPALTENCEEIFPDCYNGILDQDESDVDCGGICNSCELGKACLRIDDCKLGECINEICTFPEELELPAPVIPEIIPTIYDCAS